MGTPLRVLVVEDSEDDAELLLLELRRGGFEPAAERVETEEAMCAALGRQPWDLIIADYALPHFSAPAALAVLRSTSLDVPFIVVSGKIGEETAVALMKAGAHDYIMKDHLPRFLPAVKRELRDAEVRSERRRAEAALRESEDKYRLLFATESDAIMVFDAETRQFVDINDAALKLYGYTRDEFLKLKHWDITAEGEASDASMRQAAEGKPTRLPLRYHKKKDGTVFPVEIAAGTFVWRGRRMMVGVVRDITDRKRLEKEVLEIGDAERRRIGQDLHDSVGQQITGIGFMGSALAQKLAARAAPEAEDAQEIVRLLDEAAEQARALARGMCPLELVSGDLVPAFEELALTAGDRFDSDGDAPLSHLSGGRHQRREAREGDARRDRSGDGRWQDDADRQGRWRRTARRRGRPEGPGTPHHEISGGRDGSVAGRSTPRGRRHHRGLRRSIEQQGRSGRRREDGRGKGGLRSIAVPNGHEDPLDTLTAGGTAMAAMDSVGPLSKQARILVVDDHPIVRQGLKRLIDQHAGLVVCAEACDDNEALEAIRASKPDAAIVDIMLADASGIELIKSIKARYPDIAILVLSYHDEAIYAARALRAGASGYIMKNESAEELVNALHRVLSGAVYLSEGMASRMLTQLVGGAPPAAGSPVESLTDRELEVFEMIGRGKGTREIAEALHLSVKTIESHRAHIKEKLGLETATELLRYAIIWLASEGKS